MKKFKIFVFALILSLSASLFLCGTVTAFADNASSGDDMPPVTIYDYGKGSAEGSSKEEKPCSGCKSGITSDSVVWIVLSVTATVVLINKRRMSRK